MTNLRAVALLILAPTKGRKQYRVERLGFLGITCLVVAFCIATAIASPAQTFTTLFNFSGRNGWSPYSSLTQGVDGNFYGTTYQGGSYYNLQAGDYGYGTVYRITPAGRQKVIHSFGPAFGSGPDTGLVLGTDGNFYGTTYDYPGTVFKIKAGGKLTTLAGDWGIVAPLVQGTDGNFYGTTEYGGTGCGNTGCGTVFKITPSGTLTTLYDFCSQPNCTDGSNPYGALVQATDGNFYGTTSRGGGSADSGTVFKITPSGTLATLYSFCSQPNCSDGSGPNGGLVQATDGSLYGTTSGGGVSDGGTVFKITLSGTLSTLYSFCSQLNCPDGAYPFDSLTQGTDGNFYGITVGGGGRDCPYESQGCGTVFAITPAGTLTTLHSFCLQNCDDGFDPLAGLVQGTDGSFYGTTAGYLGEPVINLGTVFNLSVGLGPFVKTNPTSGHLGTKVVILGNNLTGTTAVSFNGTAAKFRVVRSTEVTAKVPKGATTGPVTVTTPSGTLTSNVQFMIQ